MTDVETVVQRYYGDRPVLQRISDALRAAGVDPERPSHRDLWPFDQLHSRGIVATREHAERAGIQPGMYVLDLGCGLGGASRYLAAEHGCRVAAVDLTPNFVEAARILTARCGEIEVSAGVLFRDPRPSVETPDNLETWDRFRADVWPAYGSRAKGGDRVG